MAEALQYRCLARPGLLLRKHRVQQRPGDLSLQACLICSGAVPLAHPKPVEAPAAPAPPPPIAAQTEEVMPASPPATKPPATDDMCKCGRGPKLPRHDGGTVGLCLQCKQAAMDKARAAPRQPKDSARRQRASYDHQALMRLLRGRADNLRAAAAAPTSEACALRSLASELLTMLDVAGELGALPGWNPEASE